MNLDPFDLLRLLRPPTHGRRDHDVDSAISTITAQPLERAPRRRRRLHWKTFGAIIAGVSLTAGAATAIVHLSSPTTATMMACYSNPTAPPDHQVQIELTADGDPVAACADLWGTDIFDGERPLAFAACVTPTGLGVVIPAEGGTCTDLNYEVWDVGDISPPSDVPVDAELLAGIVSEINSNCWGNETASTHMLDRLEAAGAPGPWTFTVSVANDDDRPCAAVIVDATERSIDFVAIPDLGSASHTSPTNPEGDPP